MAAMVVTETSSAVRHGSQPEVEFAECECCGLTEECTQEYIARVRERFQGRWICGLCAEAVKDESLRSDRRISTDEALVRHQKFCKSFRSGRPPVNPTEELISAMRQLLRRSLDSPRKSDPVSSFGRSKSCFSSISD